jgi:hypothetical protein
LQRLVENMCFSSSGALTPCSFDVFTPDSYLSLSRRLGVRQHSLMNIIKGDIYKWTHVSTHEPSTYEYSHVHTLFQCLSFNGLNSQYHHWFNGTYLDANCLVCLGKANTLNIWGNHMQQWYGMVNELNIVFFHFI